MDAPPSIGSSEQRRATTHDQDTSSYSPLSGAPSSAPSGDQPMLFASDNNSDSQSQSMDEGRPQTSTRRVRTRTDIDSDGGAGPAEDDSRRSSKRRAQKREQVKPAASDILNDEELSLLMEEVIPMKPSKVEANLIDKTLKAVKSKENWVYNREAATKTVQEIEAAAARLNVQPPPDAEEVQEAEQREEVLNDLLDISIETTPEQRFFVRPACKFEYPDVRDLPDMLRFLERTELRSREFLLQLDHDAVLTWLIEMMIRSPSALLAIRALQALQFLFFGVEDAAYIHGPRSGGYLPPARGTQAQYSLSDIYSSYLSFFSLERILNQYGADFEESSSQSDQRDPHLASLPPAHNLSLVIRFASTVVLATPCPWSVTQRTEYFVLFCRMLLDPLIANAINCTAGLRSALEAICASFTANEWRAVAPELALHAKTCVEHHILLRTLLRHLPSGGRVLELRTRICCMFLQPAVTVPNVAQIVIGSLEEIIDGLTDQPADPSLLVTKTLCIDFLTDTLISQLDTQAENVKRVIDLVITFNSRLRDKMHITVSQLKNTLLEFHNRLLLYLGLLKSKTLVQATLPFGQPKERKKGDSSDSEPEPDEF